MDDSSDRAEPGLEPYRDSLSEDCFRYVEDPGGVVPEPWSCPACGTTAHPVEQPNGVFCFNCRTKIISCCEGAPL